MINSLQPQTLSRKTLKQTFDIPSKSQSAYKQKSQSTKQQKHVSISNQQKCCSKYNECQNQYIRKDANDQQGQFSIDSELLREQSIIDIQIQPEIQLQLRPETDMLIRTNIKMHKFQEVYKIIQKQQKQKAIQQALTNLNLQAKQALLKSQKYNKQSKRQQNQLKWGHSIYGQQQKDQLNNKTHQVVNIKQKVQTQTKQKVQIKPVVQRIKQYKQKQFLKLKEQQEKQNLNSKQSKPDQNKLKETQQKIVKNAEQIMKKQQQDISQALKKKADIKRKILQLQKASLQNVRKSKKKPVSTQLQKQMQMGDSQYSTFAAREQGRKIIKKGKNIKKVLQQPKDNNQIIKKTTSHRNLKQIKKTIQNKQQSIQISKNEVQVQAQNPNKSKFYVWNIPIKQQDLSLFQQQKKLKIVINSKPCISFKEQAQKYILQKQFKKRLQGLPISRKQQFQQQVQQKKQQFLKQYAEQISKQKFYQDEIVFGF